MSNCRVLVTGGSGFIGTNLVESLSRDGYDVLSVDLAKPANNEHSSSWAQCDIRDGEALKAVVEEFCPEYVVHLAARTDLEGKHIDDYSTNTAGTQTLIDAVKSTQSIKKTVFASSMLVCRVGYVPHSDDEYAPSTVYGESKAEMERMIRRSELDCEWTIFRPTSIWGPWFKTPYKDFFDMVKKGTFVGIGGCANKTYGYVENAVFQIKGLLFDSSGRSNGNCYYIGDSPAININEWSKEIALEMGVAQPRVMPQFLMRSAALIGDVLVRRGIKFPLTTFRLKNMTTDNILPLSELYEIVGEPPVERRDGVRRTVAWMSNNV